MSRYELLERIGSGGMAEIFRGRAIAAGGFEKPVAIKRILPHLSEDERFVSLLISEAKILANLRHRNIVQIYDVGLAEDNQYFLVMEYIDGCDLGAVFEHVSKQGQRVPLDVALHIGAEVCEALDHAHQATDEHGETIRLVHRDVSPTNILLSRSGEVKLTDFGIAKSIEEKTGHGGVRGKFAYLSPEQAQNIRVDGRSDAYSLAIVIFELIVGRRLFSNLSDFEALIAVRDANIPRPRDLDSSINVELEDILLKALAPRPDDRYASAAEFGAALRGYRYNLSATSNDPAKSLGQLIDEAVESEDEEERTVLSPSFSAEATVETSEFHRDYSEFDEEETRAISILAPEPQSITLMTRAVPAKRIGSEDVDPEAPTVLGLDLDQFLADNDPNAGDPLAETMQAPEMIPPAGDPGGFADGLQTVADPMPPVLAPQLGSGVAMGSGSGSLGEAGIDPPTRALRLRPPTGLSTESPVPPPARPVPDRRVELPDRSPFPNLAASQGGFDQARRRPILILAIVAALVAVAAFVIAGSLMTDESGSDDSEQTESDSAGPSGSAAGEDSEDGIKFLAEDPDAGAGGSGDVDAGSNEPSEATKKRRARQRRIRQRRLRRLKQQRRNKQNKNKKKSTKK